MSNNFELDAILGNPFDPSSKDGKVAKYEWMKNINDKNEGNYADGYIDFDTLGYTDSQWTDFRHGYVTVPLSVFGKTTDLLAADLLTNVVALKNHITTLIYSTQVTLNETTAQNSRGSPLYNHIRQIVDEDIDYSISNGPLYMDALDTNDNNDNFEFSKRAIFVEGGDDYAIAARNPAFNKGFYKRSVWLMAVIKQVIGAPGSVYYQLMAILPLNKLSNLFDNLDIPLLGVRLRLRLGISGSPAGPEINPLMANAVTLGKVTNLGLSVCNHDPLRAASESKCKLWLPKVTFSSEVNSAISKLVSSGSLTKTLAYYNYRIVKNASKQDKDSLEFQITSGIQKPRRVWTVIYKKDALKSSASPAPCATASTAYLTNANIEVDGDKFYKDDISTPHEFYQMFRAQQFLGGDDLHNGTQVTYAGFNEVNGCHKYYVFDISPLTNNYPDPLKSVVLTMRGTLNSSTADLYDVYHIIEHEMNVSINMKDGEVNVVGSM